MNATQIWDVEVSTEWMGLKRWQRKWCFLLIDLNWNLPLFILVRNGNKQKSWLSWWRNIEQCAKLIKTLSRKKVCKEHNMYNIIGKILLSGITKEGDSNIFTVLCQSLCSSWEWKAADCVLELDRNAVWIFSVLAPVCCTNWEGGVWAVGTNVRLTKQICSVSEYVLFKEMYVKRVQP